MKKGIVVFLLIVLLGVPLLLGSILGVSYLTVDPQKEIPHPTMSYNEQIFEPTTYNWVCPVLGGILFKDFTLVNSPAAKLPVITTDTFDVTFAEGYGDGSLLIEKDGTTFFQGTQTGWGKLKFTENGTYTATVGYTVAKKGLSSYGSFNFEFSFEVKLDPVIEISSETVRQGDAFVLHAAYIPEGVRPTGENSYGGQSYGLTFVLTAEKRWSAFIAVPDKQDPGNYTATIHIGEQTIEFPYTVVAHTFPQQHMTIDMSDPDNANSRTDDAIAKYNAAIVPLLYTSDEECYWSGKFISPAPGRISTDYGTRRYTNGSTYPSVHQGMDIAADEGTTVVAPNNGRVVYADFLDSTGNTLVIEYGGGLKSYFYHLSAIDVSVGDMVEKGQPVAAVGSTGYSTGPHLHYEIRVGASTFDPALLISGDSSIYYKMEDTAAA